jgi:hypothetical protein
MRRSNSPFIELVPAKEYNLFKGDASEGTDNIAYCPGVKVNSRSSCEKNK